MVLGVPPSSSGLNVKANGTRNAGRVYFKDDRRTIYDRKPRLLYGVSQMRFNPIRRNGGFILHVSYQYLSRVMPDRTNELRPELEQWWRDTGA